MPKKIRVRYRKLGKEQADGIAHLNKKGIEIDERLTGQRAIGALVHELLHTANPTHTEEEILRVEKEIIPTMWAEIKKHPEKYLKGIK